ncbi:MAG: AMIN domain-containing protein, partial [Myxococcota bacterium]
MRVAFAAVLGLALGFAGPMGPRAASAKDDPSQLTKVSITRADDDIAVIVRGSQKPNFTSFTLSDPFRVVLDWAGSQLAGVRLEQQFDRGLIRLVRMRQFSSESEQISRVIVELAQPTTYRVDTDGTA